MRRIAAYVLFVVGAVLILLAPLLKFYTEPRIEKAPIDVYDVTVSDGTGYIFTPKTFSVEGPLTLKNISIAKGDVAASTHRVAVISIFTRTTGARGVGDVGYSEDVYAMDRTTGYAVHCCGERPRHSGITLKFPFGTRKQTYPFYDSTAHRAFPARYVRDETVDGLPCYVFESTVPQTFLQKQTLPGFVANQPNAPSVQTDRWYRATTTVWVEPITGAIVKAAQNAQQWATLGSQFVTTLASTRFVNDAPSVHDVADRIRTQLFELRAVQFWVPVFGPIVGVVLVVLALLMLFRGPRPATATERAVPAPQPAPVPA